MKNGQTEQSSNRKLIFAVIFLGVIVVVLAVCVVLLLPNGRDAVPSGDVEETTAEDSAATIVVMTPYCDMVYPSEFNDYLEIREFSENGIYTKQFLCTLSNVQYKLFAVHFGEGADGDFFGYLTNGDEKVSVYIECYDSPETDLLSEEEKRIYYHMMDGVNEIARSISETSGYLTH